MKSTRRAASTAVLASCLLLPGSTFGSFVDLDEILRTPLISFRTILNNAESWNALSNALSRRAIWLVETSAMEVSAQSSTVYVTHDFYFAPRDSRSGQAYRMRFVVSYDSQNESAQVHTTTGEYARFDRQEVSEPAIWSQRSFEALRYLCNQPEFEARLKSELERQHIDSLTIRRNRDAESSTQEQRYDIVFSGLKREENKMRKLTVRTDYAIESDRFTRFEVEVSE